MQCQATENSFSVLTFPDFLESLRRSELSARQARSHSVLTKLAGFPIIKTVEARLHLCP